MELTFIILWLVATMTVALGVCTLARWLGYEIIIASYAASLCAAILVAGKLGVVPGLAGFALSASLFTYSATFIFTDVLSEVFGKATARKAVFAGAFVYPIVLVTTQFSSAWTPHPSWADNQAAFAGVMSLALRVAIASMMAFLVSQLHDVWAFHFWKVRTKDRHLWLRNNLSTIVSQALDTAIFYLIAFYGIFPVGRLILATYAFKILIAAVDTPIVYAAVAILRTTRTRRLAQ